MSNFAAILANANQGPGPAEYFLRGRDQRQMADQRQARIEAENARTAFTEKQVAAFDDNQARRTRSEELAITGQEQALRAQATDRIERREAQLNERAVSIYDHILAETQDEEKANLAAQAYWNTELDDIQAEWQETAPTIGMSPEDFQAQPFDPVRSRAAVEGYIAPEARAAAEANLRNVNDQIRSRRESDRRTDPTNPINTELREAEIGYREAVTRAQEMQTKLNDPNRMPSPMELMDAYTSVMEAETRRATAQIAMTRAQAGVPPKVTKPITAHQVTTAYNYVRTMYPGLAKDNPKQAEAMAQDVASRTAWHRDHIDPLADEATIARYYATLAGAGLGVDKGWFNDKLTYGVNDGQGQEAAPKRAPGPDLSAPMTQEMQQVLRDALTKPDSN